MSLFEENAEILNRIAAEGTDLGRPRLIDFSHVFTDQVSANTFSQAAELLGFSISMDETGGDEPWDVTASKEMTPTCENITEAEKRLGDLARSHHGRPDGWGFLRC